MPPNNPANTAGNLKSETGSNLRPVQVVLMGVSGSGKTTVGLLLSECLGWVFADADDFHPPANIAKMAAGVALSDDDRLPWLEDLRRHLERLQQTGKSSVLACSALKSRYREILMTEGVRFVHLSGSKELIAGRIAGRSGHYMPESLLDSQFSALEAPGPDEDVLAVPIDQTPAEIVSRIIVTMGLRKSTSKKT